MINQYVFRKKELFSASVVVCCDNPPLNRLNLEVLVAVRTALGNRCAVAVRISCGVSFFLLLGVPFAVASSVVGVRADLNGL